MRLAFKIAFSYHPRYGILITMIILPWVQAGRTSRSISQPLLNFVKILEAGPSLPSTRPLTPASFPVHASMYTCLLIFPLSACKPFHHLNSQLPPCLFPDAAEWCGQLGVPSTWPPGVLMLCATPRVSNLF